MSLTLLQAVTAINDANMLVSVLTPLVNQARSMGMGDQDEITKEQLEAHAAATGASIEDLNAAIARLQ